MGKALIVKDGVNAAVQAEKRSIQGAMGNGVLEDAQTIDMNDPFGEMNQPRVVDATTKNIPTSLSWGIREVFFKATGTAVLSITGTDTSGSAATWYGTVRAGEEGTPSFSGWTPVRMAAFIGATEEDNGEMGLVPKPLAGDADMVLLGDGTWGLPEAVTSRINKLQKTVNDIIDALTDSSNILNGSASSDISTLDGHIYLMDNARSEEDQQIHQVQVMGPVMESVNVDTPTDVDNEGHGIFEVPGVVLPSVNTDESDVTEEPETEETTEEVKEETSSPIRRRRKTTTEEDS